ncbi:unnamed protein product [Sphagnum balticum]
MQGSFAINIPSIPSKAIRFKVQDVKTRSFGSQKQRFPEDKTYLTERFVNSFSNFVPKPDFQEATTDLKSNASTVPSACFRKGNEDFSLDSELSKLGSNGSRLREKVTDNYYFNTEESMEEEEWD